MPAFSCPLPTDVRIALSFPAMTHLSLEEAIAREVTCYGYGDGLRYSRVCAHNGDSDNLHRSAPRGGRAKVTKQDQEAVFVLPLHMYTSLKYEGCHNIYVLHRCASSRTAEKVFMVCGRCKKYCICGTTPNTLHTLRSEDSSDHD